jgi:indole-3-glycerol phosphate synthase
MGFLDGLEREKAQEARLRRSFGEPEATDPFRRRASLAAAVGAPGLSVICEVKRMSPSEGRLAELDASATGRLYEASGAAAVSVLTDFRRFGGRLEDLAAVKGSVRIPVLRKDFIVDRLQLRESLYWGADAVLLIAGLLGDRTGEFVSRASGMGLECLVEAHDERDLETAVSSGASLIGINNRDLGTLKVDLGTTERLAPLVPEGMLIVAESGISTRDDAARMMEAGADAILVGSSIVKSKDMEAKIRELRVAP